MSYTKTTWVDNSEPPISADNLNKIEQGIYDATEGLAGKVDKVTGKGLSTNDYTDAEKTKLAGIDMTTKQDTLVSGTNIKTINSETLLGSGDIDVQETLVSGTNIKTINGNSLLGSGNIVIQGGGGGGSTVAYNPTVTSGTELGKINIDGTDNPVYAPPVPTKTSDLTNDSGFLTSHQSIKTVNNNTMTGTGNVTVQETLVSGTNIKTVNSTSLLGSGNVTVQSVISSVAVNITVANWNATTSCSKSVTGVTASNKVIVSPAPASIEAWQSSGVYCSAQGSGTLTFTCKSTPTASIDVNVLVIN